MTRRIVLTDEARADLADAFAWYESQRVRLGDEFLQCIDACLKRVQQNPLQFPREYGEFRRAIVRRFPYVVFFEPYEDEITVFAIFHSARDPSKWRARLP